MSRCTCCGWVESSYPGIFGHYVDLNGEKQRVFLDYLYVGAMFRCDLLKSTMYFE